MTSAVLSAILAHGGRIVCSVTLDAEGRTIGARRASGRNGPRTCTGCGALDHDRKRCNGKGNEPKPLAERHSRRIAEAKAEIKRRIEERRR